MEQFNLVDTTKLKAIKDVKNAFRKKKYLEATIENLIKDFEAETGLAVDMIKYQRDITIPIQRVRYVGLTINISKEE